MAVGKTFIGCSGYLYPHWRDGVFYPKGLLQRNEFVYYSQIFNTVELNSTFYHQPKETVWLAWQKKAPSDFVYAVKMNRFFTHIKRLNDPQEAWDQFYIGAKILGEHLGPILFQLPPSFTKNLKKLEELSLVLPKNLHFAFEFRHLSWFDEEVYDFLKKANWALVVASHPSLPFIPKITADFAYFRFHGKEALYSSLYSDEELKNFAEIMVGWLKEGKDIYAYFNNDIDGFAPRNAQTLKKLLSNLV